LSFSYDPLGNILHLNDLLGTADATLTYHLTGDRDQLCGVSYGGLGSTTCNIDHDSFGNVVRETTRTGHRELKYFNSGAARSIDDLSIGTAEFRYDAFGGVQETDIHSGTEKRLDQRYGSFITHRVHSGGGGNSSFLSRQFPGPGVVISRRGPSGPWIFTFGEWRGNRFTTDENGAFVQDLDYEPYGETKSSGAQPGSNLYSTEQWNDGDALGPFGLVQLGARLYDPIIGRFLGRDPLLIPRSAATTNPYAFAMNDPWNGSDPSGLDDETNPYPPFDFSNPAATQPLGPEAMEKRRLEDQRYFARVFNEPQTEAGRHWKFVMGWTTGLHEAGDWWDDVGRACKTVECVSNSLQNTPLSEEDRAYNAWIDDKPAMRRQILGMTLEAELALISPRLAFVYAMGQAKNENEIVLPMLMWGVSELKAPEVCGGGKCATDATCFTAGTPIATYSGFTPIEKVRPGDRVRSLDEARCTQPIDPDSCRMVEIEMENPYGYADKLTAKFLKSEEWVNNHRIESGAEVRLKIDELQIDGRARVTSIGHCTIQRGTGCLVTGTVAHLNRSVLRLHFRGSEETLEPTALHPLWSIDREGWVRAGELEVGERLLTETGAVTIASIESRQGTHQVFNFEVAGAHTYVVSNLKIKSHNQCTGLEDLAKIRRELGLPEGDGVLTRLDIGGKSVYGINGHGQNYVKPPGVTYQSLRHAEGDAFMTATKQGLTSKTATLYVDYKTGLCGWCKSSMQGYMSLLGIDELTIVAPGVQPYTIKLK
jgi:RHS repeat-associated protein